MDGAQRTPSGRRVINGSPEPTYRQPDVPQQQQAPASSATLASAPQASLRPALTGHHEEAKQKKTSKRLKLPLIILGLLVILGAGGFFGWSALQSNSSAIDTGKYQAVFFTNGQVYFGKLSSISTEQLRLTDVYYLQTNSTTDSENPQETTTDQSDVQLIKLGDEIHGPEDEMIISKDQVLFYENLKDDGKVSQSIKQYKSTN